MFRIICSLVTIYCEGDYNTFFINVTFEVEFLFMNKKYYTLWRKQDVLYFSRDSVAGVVTTLCTGRYWMLIPAGEGTFRFSRIFETCCGAHAASYAMCSKLLSRR
jgi:hypothetical protein